MAPALNDSEFEAFRDSLCDGAIRVVARDGIGALTLRQLASEVGCSRQTPYRYFRNKDELLEEMYVRCHDVFIRYCEDAVAGVTDPREKLRTIRDVYLRFYRDEPDVYSVLFGTMPPIPMPRVAEQTMYEHNRLRSFFEEAIAEGIVEGDSGSLAYLFWSAIDGLAKLQSEDVDTSILDISKISDLVADLYFPEKDSAATEGKHAWTDV